MPLMVLCVARWEFLEDRPNWAGGIADAVTLWVEPLTLGTCHGARDGGGRPRDTTTAERVARHAGGNPYFVVEIAGMLRREERDLPPSGPAATPAPAAAHRPGGDRRQDRSAQSRRARELVRRASVFPRGRFDLDELSLIVEPRKELLAEAEDEELLVPDEDRPGVWRFGSDILRDVAYDSLAKRERQRLHLRVANKLSSDEHLERFPRTIAFHLEQAARASLDLNPRDRAIAERAVDALAHAGDIARRRHRVPVGRRPVRARAGPGGSRRGLGRSRSPDPGRAGRGPVLAGRVRSGRGGAASGAGARGRGNDRVCAHASRFLADITMTLHGDVEQRRGVVRSVARGRPPARRPVRAGAHAADGGMGAVPTQRARPCRGDVPRSARGGALGGARATRGRSRAPSWGSPNVLATVGRRGRGAGDRARRRSPSGRTPTRRSRRRSPTRRWRRRCGACCGWTRRCEHAELAIRTFRELGARWELASALGDRGAVHRVAGRLEDAEADAREAFVLCRDLQERALVTWTAAELARILAMQGDTASGAREILADPAARLAEGEPGFGDGVAGRGVGDGARRRRSRDRAQQGRSRGRGRIRARGVSERPGGAAVVGGHGSSVPRPPGDRAGPGAGPPHAGGPPLPTRRCGSPTWPLSLGR